MADVLLDQQTAPVAPAAGQSVIFVDSTTKKLSTKDATGLVTSLGLSNFSTVAQSPVAATRTYIAGSALAVPTGKLQVGTCFRWRFNLTKTAAGLAASTFDVCVGTAGTVADAARLSFAKPAGTAAADEGWIEIACTIRSIGATGVAVGEFVMYHNGNTVGHAVIPVVVVNAISAGFDMTVAALIVGVCITSGAADAVTIQMVQSEAWNL